MSLRKIVVLCILIVSLSIPLLTSNKYWLFIFSVCFMYVILSLGMNIVTGWAGQFSLGSAAFFGIGGYAAALMVMKIGFPFWLAVILASLLGFFGGLLLGYPCLRLRHMYLAMVTIAFTMIINEVLINWVDVTGGPLGLVGIPRPRIGFISLATESSYYYFVFFVTLAVAWIMYKLRDCYIGRALNAIRQDDEVAEASGINTTYYKVLSFSLSGLFSALAGGLYAFGLGFLSPETFNIGFSFLVLYMLLVGGIGTIEGAIIGGLIVGILPEALRFVSEYKLIVFSAVIIVILIYSPRGIAKVFEKH